MPNNPTVTEHPGEVVTWFKIRAGWEWASIFVRPTDGGAEVVAHSSFGTFGYTWISMGGGWRQFLRSLSREYAMRKLAGQSYDAPLDREEFVAAMRTELNSWEESTLEAWGILDSDQERQLRQCRDALDDEWGWEDVPLDALFWHFNDRAGGAPYAMEMYETRLTKINPQVVGFWETIWLPFVANIASVDTHPEGGAASASPFMSGAVPKADAQTLSPSPITPNGA